MTLTDLCRKTRNWFDKKRHFGIFDLDSELDFACEGQFYRLIGDVTADGQCLYVDYVCTYTDGNFKVYGAETAHGILNGAIWEMSVPTDFLELYEKMTAWEEKNADILNSPFQSESFGGYSYSRASGKNGSLTVWDNFADEIARYQKL